MFMLAALLAIAAAPIAGPRQMAPPVPAMAASRLPIAPAAHMARPPRRGNPLIVDIPPARPSLPLPPIQGPKDKSRPLVVIDPGHGGHDPGARNKRLGIDEKAVTLGVAEALRDALLKTGRIRVALTRDDDHFLLLQERYGIAHALGANLFISIHADASPDEATRGATVYTLSQTASDRQAARLAARENRSNILHGVNLGDKSSAVSSILIDLSQRDAMTAASHFADILHREAAQQIPFRTPYHRLASLVVLKSPDTPSVLLETGYVTNDKDAGELASRAGQRRIAAALAKAITVFFARQSVAH